VFQTSFLYLQHLTALLAAPDQGVVTATLQAFVALVRKTHIASIRYPGGPEQNARLLALAQGWGGKEQVTSGFQRSLYMRLWHEQPSSSVVHTVMLCRGWGL